MPISMFTDIMMPKWIGSMPSFIATGNRIGAMISMIDDGSMKLPASSSRMFTTSRNITPQALVDDPVGHRLRNLLVVSRNENSTALVMMYSSIALMLAESSSTFGTSLSVRSL